MELTNYIHYYLTGYTGLWSKIIQKDFLTVTHSCICLIQDLTLIHMHIHRNERSIQLRPQELWYTGASLRPKDYFFSFRFSLSGFFISEVDFYKKLKIGHLYFSLSGEDVVFRIP